MSHILRTAEKITRDLPLISLSVVNCASAGTLPAEAESLRPLQGRLNKSGSRRITACCSLGYAYHTVLLPPLCSKVQSLQMGLYISTKKPIKTSFTPASLGFCGASPTETEPSHCSFLQTVH